MRPEQDNESVDFDDEDYKSKTQVKNEMHELQALGMRLLDLKPDVMTSLPITERLRRALEETRRIKSNNALKRHRQYIGKLMRDEDLEPLQQAVDRLDTSSAEYNRIFHQLERWRERLISEGNETLQEYLDTYPAADIQHLRQLIRNSRKELELQKPLASSRKLFRYLREQSELAE
ncbi:ribosome biogenesis factor YjgA [Aestuariirhabdus sp. LZHN29]|uniref:ribosome biogenesis factor YjgA n=1 Tax=Aestuariirhabdus sp. LZHN29 TaxID=3417462 RepID=UPI003CF2138A